MKYVKQFPCESLFCFPTGIPYQTKATSRNSMPCIYAFLRLTFFSIYFVINNYPFRPRGTSDMFFLFINYLLLELSLYQQKYFSLLTYAFKVQEIIWVADKEWNRTGILGTAQINACCPALEVPFWWQGWGWGHCTVVNAPLQTEAP